MGEDNYNFGNNAASFGYGKDQRIPLSRFQQIFSGNEAQQWFEIYYKLHSNCFGFSASSSLFNKGKLTPARYQSSIDRAYNFGLPKNNATLKELMELCQISQSLTEVNTIARSTRNNFGGLIAACITQMEQSTNQA
jgi:hypothetical protein